MTMYSFIKQSKQVNTNNITSVAKFFIANLTTSQVENDKIIVIVSKTFEINFCYRKTNVAFNNNSILINNARLSTKKWNSENTNFFDLGVENIAFVINVNKDVFYRNIYSFIDRLKNMTICKKSTEWSLRDEKRNEISSFFSYHMRKEKKFFQFLF